MRHLLSAPTLLLLCCPIVLAQEKSISTTDAPPKVGDEATDFTLAVLGEEGEANLHEQLEKGPVVLLVLRGYPDYQCPLCSRQMGQFLDEAEKFAKANATVWMVYPGPANDLDRHALEFVEDRKLPDNFKMLIDPDYEFTKAWRLRWDEPRETAYPSTFVIGTDKEIEFAKISKTHGDRTRPDEVLEAIPAEPRS